MVLTTGTLIVVTCFPVSLKDRLDSVFSTLESYGLEHLGSMSATPELLEALKSEASYWINSSSPAWRESATISFLLDFTGLATDKPGRLFAANKYLLNEIERETVQLAPSLHKKQRPQLTFAGVTEDWLRNAPIPVDLREEMLNKLEMVRESVKSPWPVIRVLGTGERSIVSLVNHPTHGHCVLKHYRAKAAEVAKHEIMAFRALDSSGLVPRLYEAGDTWLLMEYIQDSGTHIERTIPGTSSVQIKRWAAANLLEILTLLRKNRQFILDLGSHNLLSPTEGQLKLYDLEFFGQYEEAHIPDLDKDFTVLGVLPPELTASYPFFHNPDQLRWWRAVDTSVFKPAMSGLSRADILQGTPGHPSVMATRKAAWYFMLILVHIVRRIVNNVYDFSHKLDWQRHKARNGSAALPRAGLEDSA